MDDFFEKYADKIIPEPNSGCWIWTGAVAATGYGHGHRDGKHFYAHRAALESIQGPLGDLDCLHRCDFPPCCNPDHLFSGTAKDNMADMWRKGRGRSKGLPGEQSGLSKLTESQVKYIRSSSRPGRELASEFGVSESCISSARRSETWRHLQIAGATIIPNPSPCRGEGSPSHKLTEIEAREILTSPDPGIALAQRYKVSPSLVSAIRNRRNWKWLK